MATSADGDPLGLQAQLDLAATALGLARAIDEIVLPATRQVQQLAAGGPREAALGVMATEAVRTWLNRRGSFAPAPLPTKPILLACGPRDRQLVGVESLALLLRYRRRSCRVLGARVSTVTLSVAARAADAAGVVVMSADSRTRPMAIDSLRAIDAMDVPVFFAGDAFEPEGSREEVPGRFLGTSMARACTLLIDALTAS